MTHDELLREIAKTYTVDLSDMGYTIDSAVVVRQAKALAAVVELHKPVDRENYLGIPMCDDCEYSSYPCSTIETIEKVLV